MPESSAKAKADHKDEKNGCRHDGRGMLAVVTFKDPSPVVTLKDPRGSIPHTQLSGPTAAALRNNAVSREMAALANRWLRVPRVGYFDHFRKVATESSIQDALQALTRKMTTFQN